MEKIYSKSNNILLHIIFKKNEIISSRTNIISENNLLQLSYLHFDKNKTFEPHYHIWKEGVNFLFPQEGWIVISGSVEAILYDTDNTLIGKYILYPGDMSISLLGGHNYRFLEDDSYVIEVKIGPYLGKEKDKITFVENTDDH